MTDEKFKRGPIPVSITDTFKKYQEATYPSFHGPGH